MGITRRKVAQRGAVRNHNPCMPIRVLRHRYYRDSKQQVEADDGDAEGDEDGPSVAPARVLNPEELLKQAEEEAHIDDIQALDAKGLRRIVTSFEKKVRAYLAVSLCSVYRKHARTVHFVYRM